MPAHKKSDIVFVPSLQVFAQARAASPITVLAGPNNSGKSLTLRFLKATLGRGAYFVGTNRFYHVYHFSSGIREPNELDSFENTFNNHFNDDNHNHEANAFDLNRIIVGMGDARRKQLFALCGELIGSRFSMQKVDDSNDLSPRYIDMDGQNLSVGSTGTRLLMTILGLCMDDRFSTILIDEPELGLSPRVQSALSTFFQDSSMRKEYFPNVQRIFIATHSQLFLARAQIESNYVVTKTGKNIAISRIQDIGAFHKLQFNLLGNDLESMFIPSAIVVVEGKTDFAYLDRVVQLRFPTKRVTLIPANGDVKKKVHGLREAFGDIDKSPFRPRLFVVLDKVHQTGLTAELIGMGVIQQNIVVWPENGIEHYYPTRILCSVFGCAPEQLQNISIIGDIVSLHGISKTKNELSKEVLRQLDSTTVLPNELLERLVNPLEQAIT